MSARALPATLLVAAAFALLHLTLTPALWPVDETAHVAYADAVARGALPTIDDPIPPSLAVPGMPQRLWWEAREHRDDRQDIWTANHPPLPYAVQAVGLRAGGILGPSGALVGARLTSVAWLLVAVRLTFPLARRLTGDRLVATVAALLVALTPSASHVAGLVFNDAAAIAMTTACLLVGVQLAQEGPSRRRAAVLVGVVGAAALTRVSVLPAVGIAMALAAYGTWRHRDLQPPGAWLRWRAPLVGAAAVGAALLPAAWFWARNAALYGSPTASRALLEKFGRAPNTPVEELIAARWFWFKAWNRMWGDLTTGHWAVWPRRGLSELILLVTAIGLAWLAWQALKAARAHRRPSSPADVDRLVCWLAVLAVPASLLVSTIAFHSAGGSLHGRYLLGGHAVTTTVIALAILRLPLVARPVVLAVVSAGVLLQAWLLSDLAQVGSAVWDRSGTSITLPMPLGEATQTAVVVLSTLAAIAVWVVTNSLWPPTGIPGPRRRQTPNLPAAADRVPVARLLLGDLGRAGRGVEVARRRALAETRDIS